MDDHSKQYSKTHSIAIKIFLTVLLLEGVAALIAIFWNPVSPRGTGTFDFSPLRLGLGAASAAFLFPLLWLTIRSFTNDRWLLGLFSRTRETLLQEHRLLRLLLLLSFLFLSGLFFYLLLSSPAAGEYPVYQPLFEKTFARYETFLLIFQRARYLVLWILLAILQALVLLLVIFKNQVFRLAFFQLEVVFSTFLLLSMLALSALHWMVLFSQMQLLSRIPGYYWETISRGFNLRDLLFPLFLLAAWAVIWICLNHRRVWLNLALLVLFGYLLQVGFGIIEGGGFESVRLKYADSWHKSHAMKASAEEADLLKTITEYDQRYGDAMFQSTKPPGVMFLYVALEKLVDFFARRDTQQERFMLLTQVLAVSFPLVSMLVLGVLYKMHRMFSLPESSFLPPLLYLSLPNVILIPVFLDQAVYPLIFISTAFLIITALRRQSTLLGALAGIVIYIAVFLSFSMLPLIPFTLLFFIIDYLANRSSRSLRSGFLTLSGIAAASLMLFWGFAYFLNYNVLTRYEGAMQVVRGFDFALRVDKTPEEALENTSGFVAPAQILSAFLLNNLEFAAAVGFPVFLLFVSRSIRTLIHLARRKVKLHDQVLAAFLLTFLALNVFAPIQGEAARLWLFWAPMLVLFAGIEIPAIFKNSRNGIYTLITLQMISMYLLYKFQDFIV